MMVFVVGAPGVFRYVLAHLGRYAYERGCEIQFWNDPCLHLLCMFESRVVL